VLTCYEEATGPAPRRAPVRSPEANGRGPDGRWARGARRSLPSEGSEALSEHLYVLMTFFDTLTPHQALEKYHLYLSTVRVCDLIESMSHDFFYFICYRSMN
jgi:hypothetical protein